MYQAPSLNRIERSYRLYVQSNPTSFSSSPVDDYRQAAINAPTPTRNTLTPDATAWGTQPTADSWWARCTSQNSPARPTAAQGNVVSGVTP